MLKRNNFLTLIVYLFFRNKNLSLDRLQSLRGFVMLVTEKENAVNGFTWKSLATVCGENTIEGSGLGVRLRQPSRIV